jgi:hypothetical protein
LERSFPVTSFLLSGASPGKTEDPTNLDLDAAV